MGTSVRGQIVVVAMMVGMLAILLNPKEALAATFTVTAAVLGYSAGIAGHRPPLASMLLIALIVLVTYLIIDLDRPRRGLVQVSQAPLQHLQQSMETGHVP